MNLPYYGLQTAPYELVFHKEPDYNNTIKCFNSLESISTLANINISVLDYYKHQYAYLSDNHLFNCGYTREEADNYDENFGNKILFEKDLKNLIETKNAAFLFFKDLTIEQLKKTNIYNSHRITHKNGTVMLVSNKYRPILFDDEGNTWMLMCITTLANKNHKIETRIETEINGVEEEYFYNEKKKTFIKSVSKKLSQKEQEILMLCAQGFTSKEIAEKKFISLSTVKFHKQNILSKFHLNNMSEAILYAYAHNLFGKANEYML